jgi:hypothetical protein
LPRWWKPNANAYSNHHTTSISYANGDSDDHTTSIGYANSDSYNHAEANTNATAAAYAISSSDAVSEWANRFKIVTK